MTTATAPQPTGFAHPYMTPRQAKWLFDLINSRVGNGPSLQSWKDIYFGIDSRFKFETAIKLLKEKPVLVGDAHKPAAASETGLYRDPETNILYRVKHNHGYDDIVSVYSEKARLRRIVDETGEDVVVKGKWTRKSAWDSRQLLSNRTHGLTILAEWQMTDADKIAYRTGICNFCYRGLKDARSVKKNYGPDCAKDHNLPWGD